CGLGVAQVRPGTRVKQRLASLGGLCPSGDVDEPDQVSLAIDQEERSHAIAKAMEALDRRQPRIEGGGAFDVLVTCPGLAVFGCEEGRASRAPPVFVGR